MEQLRVQELIHVTGHCHRRVWFAPEACQAFASDTTSRTHGHCLQSMRPEGWMEVATSNETTRSRRRRLSLSRNR
jgi:hypothetical protein